MRKKMNGNAVLVAVELGADWPQGSAITPSASSAGTVRRVVSQDEGEGPAQFTERVAGVLDDLRGRGLEPSTFALACNERLDETAQAARRRLAGLVLGAMARRKAGKLYLSASSRSSGRLRHALSAAAHGLFQEWRTAGLEVSVDFGDEHDASGASSQPLAAPAARVA